MNRLSIFAKKFILGEALIAKIPSEINGAIEIYEDIMGKRRLKVGKLTQSGGEMDRIMKLVFSEVYRVQSNQIRSVLMFGLGAGTWIRKARKYWPNASVAVIELDQAMIDIAKQYFHLDRYGDIKVISQDAFSWLNVHKNKIKYDLIIFDLYLGIDFPVKQTQSNQFVNDIKLLLNKNGLLVINRLNWGIYRKETDKFQRFYEGLFDRVWTRKTLSNRLIFCQDGDTGQKANR